MKDKFLSSVSLFDLLAMVVPGGLILALISHWLGYSWEIDTKGISNEFIIWGYIFILSYLVGLMNNSLMNYIFRCFRNNPCCICKEFICGNNKYKTLLLKDLRNHIRSCIKKRKLRSEKQKHFKCCYHRTIIDKYYDAYYYGMKYPSHESIMVMERQVVLMRNLLFPLILAIVQIDNLLHMFYLDCKCIKCFYIVGILALYFTMVSRQNKIYRCVWENYEYLKRLEAKEQEATKQ